MSKKVALFSILLALAFLFSYIEALFPLPLPFPGMKLGFANIILILALYHSGYGYALLLSILRNVLTAFSFGNLFLFFYSFAGSIFSLSIMAFILHITKRKFHPVCVSAAGGIMHNLGQLIMASLFFPVQAVLSYLPVLYFCGLFTGCLMGFLVSLCFQRLGKYLSNFKINNTN